MRVAAVNVRECTVACSMALWPQAAQIAPALVDGTSSVAPRAEKLEWVTMEFDFHLKLGITLSGGGNDVDWAVTSGNTVEPFDAVGRSDRAALRSSHRVGRNSRICGEVLGQCFGSRCFREARSTRAFFPGTVGAGSTVIVAVFFIT